MHYRSIYWLNVALLLLLLLAPAAVLALRPLPTIFFFFVLVTDFGPYKEDAADRLKMLSESQLFVTLLCSLMLQVDLCEQLISRAVIDTILVTVNVFAMPIVLGLIIMGALGKKNTQSGEVTLRADLAKRAGIFEVEMGDVNPLHNSAA